MRHLFQRFRRDIIGLIWLSMGIFLALSLYSYHPKDPSLSSWGNSATIYNYCGYLGSFLADFFYQLLGLSSWVLVALSLRAAYFTFQRPKATMNRWRALCLGLLILTASCMASLYWPEATFFGGKVQSGGAFGLLMTGWLIKALNYWGLSVILWTLAVSLLVLLTLMPLTRQHRLYA